MTTANPTTMTTENKDAALKAYDPHDTASVFEAMFGCSMPKGPDRVPEPESDQDTAAERLAEIEAECRDCIF